MKLWIGILIGVFIGFMIGGIACNILTEKYLNTLEIVDDALGMCVDELIECDNRSSTNIEKCGEILDEGRGFYDNLLKENWDFCEEMLEKSRVNCDERIEEYKAFIGE